MSIDEETAKELGVREVRDNLHDCVEILEHLDYPELEEMVDEAYDQAKFRDRVRGD